MNPTPFYYNMADSKNHMKSGRGTQNSQNATLRKKVDIHALTSKVTIKPSSIPRDVAYNKIEYVADPLENRTEPASHYHVNIFKNWLFFFNR